MNGLRFKLIAAFGFSLFLISSLAMQAQVTEAQDSSLVIFQKLKTYFVSIDFTNSTIEQAIAVLEEKSKQDDYEHKGIQFDDEGVRGMPARLTLKLNKVPLSVALHYICELEGVRYNVDRNAVFVMPLIYGDKDLDRRTFHVDPGFFESLSSSGVIPTPQPSR